MLVPYGNRIVVRPSKEQETSVGGIILPDIAKERPQWGEVIAVGPGRYEDGTRVPPDISIGDKVVYAKFSGTEIKIDGEDLLILKESEILLVKS